MSVRSAYRATPYSLRAYFLSPDTYDADGNYQSYTAWTELCDFEKKYHLTRKNTLHCLEGCRRWLAMQSCGHRWLVTFKSPQCEERFKNYCLYERKNHPAKKGKGRRLTGISEMDAINRILYPQWFTTKSALLQLLTLHWNVFENISNSIELQD
jgi:hypothetical protein